MMCALRSILTGACIASIACHLIFLTACSHPEKPSSRTLDPNAPWPRTIIDSMGRTVTVNRPPERIIPIFASNTELLHALGLRPKMVGREEMARHPPDILDLPVVGGKTAFSVEGILAQNPDLVVLTPARQAAGTLAAPLERMGIPTVVLQHPTVDSIFDNLLTLGHLNGQDQLAQSIVNSWREQLSEITNQVDQRSHVTVFLETGSLSGGIIATVQPLSYSWNMVELAGGTLPWKSLPGPGQVSWESIIQADPDFYLVARTDHWQEEAQNRPGWDQLKAVKNGNVHTVNRAHLLIPGPRVLHGIQELAAILHPSLDPIQHPDPP